MDQAKYELIKKVRKMKDALRAKKKFGDAGRLARKIAARREHVKQIWRAKDKKFEARKQSRIDKGKKRMDKKAAKFSARASKWEKKWEKRVMW